MSDPFAPSSHDQLMREAQRGLAIFAVLLAVLFYVAFDRYTGRSRQLPEHVRNAPVAQTVWPYSKEAPDSASRHAARHHVREFDAPKQDLAQQRKSAAPSTQTVASSGKVKTAEFQVESREAPDPSLPSNMPTALATSAKRDFKSVSGNPIPPIKKDKPFPHNSLPSLETRSIASTKSVDGLNSELDGESNQTKQDIARNADFPLDPFESSTPQKKTVPVNRVVSHEEVQTNPKPLSHFTPDTSPFQPILDENEKSESSKSSRPIDQTVGNEPRLNAPNPIALPANEGHSANMDQVTLRSKIADRPVVSSFLHSFDPGSKPNQGDVQSAPATQIQVKYKKSTFHIVAAGESFYSIAQQYYGDGGYFRALWYFNQINSRVSQDLSIGMEIEIPTAGQLQKDFPNEVPLSKGIPLRSANPADSPDSSSKTKQQPNASSNPIQVCSAELEATEDGQDSDSPQGFLENSYLTRDGETLFEIAANELGQASRYLEILEKNRECLPDGVSGSTPLPANLTLLLPK